MLQSTESSPETAETNETTTPEQGKSKVQSLEDLFREVESPEQGNASDEDADGEPVERPSKQGKPKGLKDAAERLGLKPEDLYAIEVPMSDGKTKTLGQLKDLAAKEDDISVRELQHEESRTQRESELRRERAELDELMSLLPPTALKQEVRDAIRQKVDLGLKRERTKTLEVIPEWRDEAKRTEEIQGIAEYLKDFGFAPSYLLSVSDHRLMKLIRESYLRQKRTREAFAKFQPAKASGTKASKPNGAAKRPATAPRKAGTSRRDNLAQLFSQE